MASYEPQPYELDSYKFLYSQASNGTNQPIGGQAAVQFFVKSGLPTATLKVIWSTSVNGSPTMGSREFFTAMRLISLAQNGKPSDAQTLYDTMNLALPLPKFTGIEYPAQQKKPGTMAQQGGSSSALSGGSLYSMSNEAKANYEKLWETLPKNELTLLGGKDAAGFLAKSGQPQETLKQIWRLADVSQDGMLDLTEFMIAMHLTMLAKKGNPVPSELPQELLSAAKSASIGNAVMSQPPPARQAPPPAAVAAVPVMAASSAMMMSSSNAGGDDAAMISNATARMNESTSMMKQASARMQGEVGALKSEKDRLLNALSQANAMFLSESDKLNALTEEVNRLRDEVAGLRMQVDSKRSAVSTTQDLISNKLNEKADVLKSAPPGVGATDLGVGQKRRAAPTVPPGSEFESSAPSQPSNAFDAFDDPYSMQ